MCGPEPMMRAVRRLLVDQLGIPDAEVLEEAFVSPPSTTGAVASDLDAAVPVPDESDPTGGDQLATVRFSRAGKTVEQPAGLTVLEAAEDAGVTIPFECRSGICGQCKTRLLSGTVTMDVQDALTPADRSKRLILACQAHAVGAVVVDA
jgi:ferredoxin